jgi:mono/diheme cytochrome c family protein
MSNRGYRMGGLLAAVLLVGGGMPAQDQSGSQLSVQTPRLPASIDGAVLFRAYCASCHGLDGKGVGPMTEWLKIVSPDLTRIGMREGGAFPLTRIQRVISGEASLAAGHGSREMPVWGPVFSEISNDQDLGKMRIYNLAKFIESIQARK